MSVIQIGLLGCGTVGTGVLKLLRDNGQDILARLGASIEVKHIVVRDPDKPRDEIVDQELLTTDPEQVLNDPDIPLVVEVMGGIEPARTWVLRALKNGKSVITANKALLAKHGAEIFQVADEAGRDVIFEAAVAGGIPIIRMLREGLASDRISAILGIINGTSNFILTEMSQGGHPYDETLKRAQEKGFAEADPTMDVGGFDAAQKLSILMAISYGTQIDSDAILTEGLQQISPADIRLASRFGYVIKPLAIARCHAGELEARVHPTLIPKNHMLAAVDGVFNAIMVQSDAMGPLLFSGKGAGMMPTAMSVVSDIIELGRNVPRDMAGRLPHLAFHPHLARNRTLRDANAIRCRHYLRFPVVDEAGVLSQITGILGRYEISISQMIQEDTGAKGPVDVVILTHHANEGAIKQALAEISKEEYMQGIPCQLRIEDN